MDLQITHPEETNNLSILLSYFMAQEQTKCFILTGAAGIGKSYLVSNALEGKKVIMRSGVFSAIEFYESFLGVGVDYIVFDDCDGLFSSKQVIALLKNLLTKGFMEWRTRGIRNCTPKRLSFKGKLVIIHNEQIENKAITSRSLTFLFKPSIQHLNSIFEKILINSQDRESFRKLLLAANIPFTDLRLANVFNQMLKTCNNPETVFSAYLSSLPRSVDDVYLALESDLSLSVEERVYSFCLTTGLSRRSYFRLKLRLSGFPIRNALPSSHDEAL